MTDRAGSRSPGCPLPWGRTGALRDEHAEPGRVWRMIPSKSMLPDARRGQRLADACRV